MCGCVQSHIGVKGLVSDEEGNPISHAIIKTRNITEEGQDSLINHHVTSGTHIGYLSLQISWIHDCWSG